MYAPLGETHISTIGAPTSTAISVSLPEVDDGDDDDHDCGGGESSRVQHSMPSADALKSRLPSTMRSATTRLSVACMHRTRRDVSRHRRLLLLLPL
jgi:hypothetical protein